jgi:hypothetical protein
VGEKYVEERKGINIFRNKPMVYVQIIFPKESNFFIVLILKF